MAESYAGAAAALGPNKGVRTQHPDYARMAQKWKRCRDVAGGQDAVHDAGETYLPRLAEQDPIEYGKYKLRATFYNATWRTIAGLSGMLFRKPPAVDVAESLAPLLDDVTMGGVSLQVFSQNVAEHCLTVGRVGVLVDYPTANVQALSQAAASVLNLRPTLCLYRAESIINWRCRVIANQHVLSLVVLAEETETDSGDFATACETRYRVLDLDPTGKYRVRLFRIDEKGNDQQVDGDVYPLLNGKPLTFIPFVFLSTDDTTPDVDDPPLIDLVDMNLAHYRVTADYEHGCHFTGLPTPVVSGYSPPPPADGMAPEKLYIGSTSAWIFTDPNAKASYLEFTGEGLSALERNLDRKEQQMAVLGARMLEQLKKGIESAETASIHRVGEESVLASIAQTVSIGLTRALGWFALWAGSSDKASIDLNRSFYPVPMTADQLTALIAGWQGGAYSYETLFANLQQGEVIAADANPEDEQAKIAESAPKLMPAPPAARSGNDNLPAAA